MTEGNRQSILDDFEAIRKRMEELRGEDTDKGRPQTIPPMSPREGHPWSRGIPEPEPTLPCKQCSTPFNCTATRKCTNPNGSISLGLTRNTLIPHQVNGDEVVYAGPY